MLRKTTVALAALSLATAAGFAGFAIADVADNHAEYRCADGERFAVSFDAHHLRLRDDTGLFTLQQTGEHRFEGPDTTLLLEGEATRLERTGQPAKHCQRVVRAA